MLAVERHRHILQLVAEQGSVRTAEIANALRVAEETIRRDFEKLEAEGRLVRTYGGALRGEASRRDLPFTSREQMNTAEKRLIARKALEYVAEGDTIFLDASSTVLEMARLLPDRPLVVLTGALQVALELASRPAIQVVMLGGSLTAQSLSCVGPLADYALESYNVQKAFLSCRGVDVDRGYSESNDEQARLKRKTIALSERTYMLADHTKLPLKSLFFFAKPAEIDVLITDRPPDAALAAGLARAGAEVAIASQAVA
jgi:DeoR/GlpR family transcriptional regulator of sugar metabolism